MSNALLQKLAAGYGVGTGVRTLQYATNVSAGSLLTICVSFFGNINNSMTVSVSDNVNGAWTQAGGYSRTGTQGVCWFYFANSAGGAKPIVSVVPSQSNYLGLGLHEHSVTSPTSATVYATSMNSGVGTSQNTGTCSISGSGDLVLAGLGQSSASPVTVGVGSPFVVEANVPGGPTAEAVTTADDLSASASEGATFTTGSSVTWSAMAISFTTSTTTVGKDNKLVSNTRALAGKSSQTNWDTRALCSQSLQLLWNARVLTSKSENLLWGVRKLATASNQLVWNERALAGKLAELLWNDLAKIGQDNRLVWSTLKTREINTVHELVMHVQTTRELTFNVH